MFLWNHRSWCFSALAFWFSGLCSGHVWAAGSGLNVIVLVNQESTNSVQLGNYYAEQRHIPPLNVLRIHWTGTNTEWTTDDYQAVLLNPLQAMLSERQLTNQADFVVLSMDIPYRVTSTTSSTINSTTSTLFYGFKPDANPPCSLAPGSTSGYAGSEGIFRSTPPLGIMSNAFLVTMITSSNLALAKQIVDNGVSGDSTFPTQTVYLIKGPDTARNVRYLSFDNAIFNTRLRGNYSMVRSNVSSYFGFTNVLGYQFGDYFISMSGFGFLPGSLVDDLTSWGGLLFQENSGQLDLLAVLGAGAAGSYGTVDEPCNYLEKFPSPQDYFYQARGFSLAESYYQSLTNPYQGLLVGEPLSAPFAQSGTGSWLNLSPNPLVRGVTNLSIQLTASDAAHPLEQVDLFVDGAWHGTVTNFPPGASNLLTVNLNGQAMDYLVPGGAEIEQVAAGLCELLNSNTPGTHVSAFNHGDRIELQSMDRNMPGTAVLVSATDSRGSAGNLTTFVEASRPAFLDTTATGLRSFEVAGAPTNGSFLACTLTQTNGVEINLAVTNTLNGTTLDQMVQALLSRINTDPRLQGGDGVSGQDEVADPSGSPVDFNLVANSSGWNAAELRSSLSGTFLITPTATAPLEDNLADLRPRDHLYVKAGMTNLTVTFAFDSGQVANGFHELTAVAYEGSHVRTQTRVSQTLVISNAPLAATFTTLVGGSNTALEATLRFKVAANTNNVASIELFSTGGSLGTLPGPSPATFSVAASFLGIGLHPFYALVTGTDGVQYQTETKWIRILGNNASFTLSLTGPPPTLSWPAIAGRSYDLLSTTNLLGPFQFITTVIPTNSTGQLTDTNSAASQRFYRLRTSN